MTDFLYAVAFEAPLIFVALLVPYFTGLLALRFHNSGLPAEWEALLKKVRCKISSDRVSLNQDNKIASLHAPLQSHDQLKVKEFLAHHDAVERAKARLVLINKRANVSITLAICSLAISSALQYPLIWGQKPLANFLSLPYFAVAPLILTLVLSLLFFHPHVDAWTNLKSSEIE